MSSCCGFRRHERRNSDTEALLPEYQNDPTQLQKTAHSKLHTFQMLRALSLGYMPSTEQAIVNLRTILASDLLNAETPGLSDSSILLIKYSRRWLQEFIELLRSKNDDDQIQDLLWYASKSKIYVDSRRLAKSASSAKEQADTRAAYQSLYVVGRLLMTNSDFRVFLGDLGTIGRQIFSDIAYSFSNVARQAGQEMAPSDQEQKSLDNAENEHPLRTEDLEATAGQVSKIAEDGIAQARHETASSVVENLSGNRRQTLLQHLKSAVLRLRQRPDYSDSVSTIGSLLERYALAYSRSLDHTAEVTRESVNSNVDLDQALKSFWTFLTSFGDRGEWTKLQSNVEAVIGHMQSDTALEVFVKKLSELIQNALQDPDFYDAPEKKMRPLLDEFSQNERSSSLRSDLEAASKQAQKTLETVIGDEKVAALLTTSSKVFQIFAPTNELVNKDLLQDLLQVSIPLLLQSIQYIPIPRLEISVPEIDLLLENLIIEPGRTVNNTSFLPYKLLIQTQNDLEIRKSHIRQTTASTTNLITISIKGLSFRAEETGYWLRAHKNIFAFGDVGVASFEVDERGIDITLDVEIGKERLESILSLRGVDVHVHKLNYQLRKSKLSWLAWLVKPIMRPIMRKVMEAQLATAIADGLHAANRELLFARERLRATRISDPQDLRTFIKAVITRLTPAEDPDIYTYLGVRPSKGIFEGVYAPGSLVKLWEDEARFAKDKIEDNEIRRGGWKNEIFDVVTNAP